MYIADIRLSPFGLAGLYFIGGTLTLFVPIEEGAYSLILRIVKRFVNIIVPNFFFCFILQEYNTC
jgi:hypothetical protein